MPKEGVDFEISCLVHVLLDEGLEVSLVHALIHLVSDVLTEYRLQSYLSVDNDLFDS
jgi:hypothetical protein